MRSVYPGAHLCWSESLSRQAQRCVYYFSRLSDVCGERGVCPSQQKINESTKVRKYESAYVRAGGNVECIILRIYKQGMQPSFHSCLRKPLLLFFLFAVRRDPDRYEKVPKQPNAGTLERCERWNSRGKRAVLACLGHRYHIGKNNVDPGSWVLHAIVHKYFLKAQEKVGTCSVPFLPMIQQDFLENR